MSVIRAIKDLVHAHVLGDFSKADREWVAPLCDIIADNAGLAGPGDDAGFQNKVHLALQAKGLGNRRRGKRRRTVVERSRTSMVVQKFSSFSPRVRQENF